MKRTFARMTARPPRPAVRAASSCGGAEDVAGPTDVPGFDRSNVDGYAVQAADTFGAMEQAPRRLRRLAEAVRMGAVPASAVTPGRAMAIPTGGVVPRGADAIVMVEHT